MAELGAGAFKSIPSAFPLDFALMLRDICHVQVFVETGTYYGETTRLVAPHFSKVYTIEGVRERWEAIQGALPDNVHSLVGDSGLILGDTLRSIGQHCLIFLDAHWIHAGSPLHQDEYQRDLPACPLLAELKQINMSVEHVILIDDLFFFDFPPRGRGEWPSLDQIMVLLRNRFVFVWHGRLCAVPEAYRKPVRAWLLKNWRGKRRYEK